MNLNISNRCQNIPVSTSSKLLLERVQEVTTQHEQLQQCNNNSNNTQYNENVVVAANTRSISINNETTSYNTSSTTPLVTFDENVINTPQMETESSYTQQQQQQQQQQQTPICRNYYDEGMYLYTSDICTITTNTTTTSTTAIITSYNTGQSLIRNEKYTDAIVHFDMALRNLDPCNSNNNSNHTTELAIIEHHIYYNIGYCYYMMQHQKHNQSSTNYFNYDQPIHFYEMALKVALSYQLESIHIASTQNAIIVLHLHQKQQYQQQQVQVQVSQQLSIPEQLNILLQCYDVYVDTYGTYSKESATILYNIGRVQVLKHDYYTAIITFEQCLQIRTQLFGNCNEKNTHTMDIAVCICSIGQTYHRIGKTDIALDMYTRYMNLNEQFNHVPFHQDLGFILCCMADIYLSKGDVSLAIEKYNYIIQHRTSIYGSNNLSCSTNLINVYTKLGDILYKKQDYHVALQCYMECIRIEDEVSIHKLSMSLPPQQRQNCRVNVSPNYIVLLLKIADVQRHLKLYDSAGQVYMKLYEIHVSIYGLNSLEVAQILSYMGTTLYDDKKFNMALAYYFDALKIQLIQHSFQDTVIASSTLNCIGLVYFQQRQYMSAELCFTESLRMKIKILGGNHYSNAVLWYNIASTNYELGRHERAISFYLAAIRIERQQCAHCVTNDVDSNNNNNNCVDNQKKNDSPSCRACQLRCSTRSIQKLGSIYQKQGELEEAMKYYSEALSIELSHNENNKNNSYQNIPTIAKLYNLIGNVHLQLANVQPMMESYIAASRLIRRYHVERNRNDSNNNNNNNIGNNHNPNRNQGFSIVITGYKLYYLSRMHPPGASAA